VLLSLLLLARSRRRVVTMIRRTHAKIVSDAATGRVTLFDRNSTNGVYLNNCKIDVAQLRAGDRITFGGRGKGIKVGAVDPQPDSEFVYRFECDDAQGEDDDDEEEGTFELLKELTDHVQLLLTWAAAAWLAGTYLFADEQSEEFTFASDLVAPVFARVHLPFNRTTFTASFVLGVCALLVIAMWIVKCNRAKGKGKGKKKAQ